MKQKTILQIVIIAALSITGFVIMGNVIMQMDDTIQTDEHKKLVQDIIKQEQINAQIGGGIKQ